MSEPRGFPVIIRLTDGAKVRVTPNDSRDTLEVLAEAMSTGVGVIVSGEHGDFLVNPAHIVDAERERE